MDARREEEAAARDRLMFARYQEGKVSGSEILDYIRGRISQFSSYDRAKANEWRAALVQYQTAISDDRAEAAYAQDQDIHALISHYAQRLNATKAGTPEYRDLAERLRGLRTQRDTDDLRRGAQRIQNQIARGDATSKDLIAFYRQQLPGLEGDLRLQVRGEITQLQEERRNELFSIQMQRIDTRLASGEINPQQAADQKQDVLQRFDILTRDPASYWQWQDQVRQLRATPDPREMARWETMVLRGDKSVQQYQDKLNEWADRIAPYDQTAAWEMRSDAIKGMEGATPLPNPEYLTGASGKSIRHISQLDGSRYSQINCTMASAAMLAYAMGIKGLSGGDLRYLSGDTSGGTTIMQAQAALQRAGVGGTKARYNDRIEFEAFRRKVANGAPASLSGYLGSIPAAYNNPGMNAGHNIFVAAYDPKKGFLIMDPAVGRSGYKGEWWPERVLQSFGWGQASGANYRYGQALFAPRGTLVPGSLKRVRGAEVHHVSVNAKPLRSGTPSSYYGQFHPGPDAKNTIVQGEARRQKRESRRLERRLERAGVPEGIDTVQEAQAELANREAAFTQAQSWLDEFDAQYRLDPEAGSYRVTIGGESQRMTLETVHQLQRELLYSLDGQEMILQSIGDSGGVKRVRGQKGDIITQAAALNTIDHEVLEERLSRDILGNLMDAEKTGDPDVIPHVLEESASALRELNESAMPAPEKGGNKKRGSQVDQQAAQVGTVVSPEEQAESDLLLEILEALGDPEMASEERIDQVLQWAEATGVDLPNKWPNVAPEDSNTGSALGLAVTGMVKGTNRFYEVERGEAKWVIVGGGLETLPVRDTGQVDPMTGEPITTVDLSALPKEVRDQIPSQFNSSATLPSHAVQTSHGVELYPVVPQITQSQDIEFLQVAKDGVDGLPGANTFLTNDQMAQLGMNKISQYLGSGALQAVPFEYAAYQGVTQIVKGQPVEGKQWVYDPRDQQWHEGGFPFAGNQGLPSAFPWVGADPNTPEGFSAIPEAWYEPNLDDPTTTGVPVGFSPAVSKIEMQRLVDQGAIPQAQFRYDGDGNVVQRTPQDPPAYTAMASIAEATQKIRAAFAGAAAGVVGAVSGAVQDEVEISRAYAPQMGISPGLAGPGMAPAMPDMDELRRIFGVGSSVQEKPAGYTPPEPKRPAMDTSEWLGKVDKLLDETRERRERPRPPRPDIHFLPPARTPTPKPTTRTRGDVSGYRPPPTPRPPTRTRGDVSGYRPPPPPPSPVIKPWTPPKGITRPPGSF